MVKVLDLRRVNNLTQEELASILGCSRSNISQLEAKDGCLSRRMMSRLVTTDLEWQSIDRPETPESVVRQSAAELVEEIADVKAQCRALDEKLNVVLHLLQGR